MGWAPNLVPALRGCLARRLPHVLRKEYTSLWMSDGRKVMMLFELVELVEPIPTKAYPMQNENSRDRLSDEDHRKFKEALVELSATSTRFAVQLGRSTS